MVAAGGPAAPDLGQHVHHGAAPAVAHVRRLPAAGAGAAPALHRRHAAVPAHRLHAAPGGTTRAHTSC